MAYFIGVSDYCSTLDTVSGCIGEIIDSCYIILKSSVTTVFTNYVQ